MQLKKMSQNSAPIYVYNSGMVGNKELFIMGRVLQVINISQSSTVIFRKSAAHIIAHPVMWFAKGPSI
jgi:hypothetical protein